MDDLSVDGVPVTHGHKVAIGTLAATAFTEIFFADPSGPPAAPAGFRRPAPSQRMLEVSESFKGSRAHDSLVKIAMEKLLDDKTAANVEQSFRDNWKDIRQRVLTRLLPYGELKALLGKALCPLTGKEIGLSRSDVIATARRAQMMRNKYCVIDLAWDIGAMEGVLAKMEESESYLN
jgi:glycerol-1-phosphate dehydrogenase [NAD(P)+]